MAFNRTTPKCKTCGEIIAKGIYRDQSYLPDMLQIIGDTFDRWEYFDCINGCSKTDPEFFLGCSNNSKNSKQIKITVSGEAKCGKSNILALLKTFLKQNGFDVSFDGGIDYNNEQDFDKYVTI